MENNDLCCGLVTQHGSVNPEVKKVHEKVPREKYDRWHLIGGMTLKYIDSRVDWSKIVIFTVM